MHPRDYDLTPLFRFFLFSGAGGWRGAPKRPRMPGRKGNTEKGKERGQAAEMFRSPLLMTWKCVRARSAKVHACGAQLKTRISRNFGEGRESAVEIPRKKNSLTAALAANFERLQTTAEREKSKICRAAATVHGEWKKGTKIMKKSKTESNRSPKMLKSVSKSKRT